MKAARILIVEDEAIVALDLRTQLTQLGYVVVETVARGEAAIEAAEKHRPDLVLMDIRLQGKMDGVEAAEVINTRFQLPVVYLTAHADESTVDRARITKPFGYILKPFDGRELRTVIEMALYKHAADKKLRTSERRYASTLASIGDGVIATDKQGRVTFMNPVAERLSGWTTAEAQGIALTTVFRIVNEETHKIVVNPVERVLEQGIVVGLANHTILIRRDGHETPIDDCAAPIHDDLGVVTGAVLVFRDISASRRIEEQLRQSQKMEALGQLAGGVAHDFNNMLTVILNYTDILLHSAGSDHPWKGFLTEIRRAGERSADLTRRLLALCHKQLVTPKVQDLNEVIAQTEPMLQRLIGDRIELETRLEQDLGSVLSDAGQLEQILLNLVVNGRDAISKHGKIVIETRNVFVEKDAIAGLSPGTYRMLRVSDNGQGIPASIVERIFEPFFTTKELGKGTGLGLATVYGIVQQCHGSIHVESTVGQGTAFTIHFPPVTKPAFVEEPIIASELPKGNETVLLVEDEVSIRDLTKQLLVSCGYTVLEAEHGEQALQVAAEYSGKIDVIVTDVMMPVMDGPAMVEKLKANFSNLKVVYISGFNNQEIEASTMGSTTSTYLSKPFKLTDLAQAVRRVLDAR